jgi:ABC-2 type transport system permease protein
VRNRLEYRFTFYASLVLTPLVFLTIAFLWSSVYSTASGGEVGGFSLQEMLSYYAVAELLFLVLASEVLYDMTDEIKSGDISVYLTKPMSFHLYNFFRNLGNALVSMGLRAIPLLVIFKVFFDIFIQTNILVLAGFFASVVFAAVISFLVVSLIACLTFFDLQPWASAQVFWVFTTIFSGALVPLSLYPAFLRGAVEVTPFALTTFVPVMVYLGKINYSLEVFALQAFWVAALFILLKLVWSFSIKRITIYGG